MSVQELRKYGPLSTTFRGKGVGKFSDGHDRPVRFTLAQRRDAQLLFCVDVKMSEVGFPMPTFGMTDLVGELDDGRQIRAEGFFVHRTIGAPSPAVRLLGYSNCWTIGDVADLDQASISFDIANFKFLGTEVDEVEFQGRTRLSRSLMPLDLGGCSVTLRQVLDYAQVETSLRAQRGVEITCTATTHVNNGQEIEYATDIVDRLCDLMSIARGTLASWTAFRIKSYESGKHHYERYRNSVTRRFAGTDVIPCQDGENTKLFLERGFKRSIELEDDFDVRKIARAYCETRDGPFLQTRSLAIGVLAEYLANIRARLDNRTHLVDEGAFQAGWPDLRLAVEQVISACYPHVPSKRAKAMSASLKNLNRRPLSWRLRELASSVDLKYEPREMEHFVKMRNSLAHEGEFPDDEKAVDDYRKIQHFLDRLILRLFDYHGPYNNFETVRRAKI